MLPNPQETFTEEILNGKLHFVCSVCCFSDENPTYAKFSDELKNVVTWRTLSCSLFSFFNLFVLHYSATCMHSQK